MNLKGIYAQGTSNTVDAGAFDRWWRPLIIDLQSAAKGTASLALENKEQLEKTIFPKVNEVNSWKKTKEIEFRDLKSTVDTLQTTVDTLSTTIDTLRITGFEDRIRKIEDDIGQISKLFKELSKQ